MISPVPQLASFQSPFQNNMLLVANESITSRLAHLELTSRNQQSEISLLGRAPAENTELKQKKQDLLRQQSSTFNSLATAQTENANLLAELQALQLHRQQTYAVRSSLDTEASTLKQAAASLSVRSESLQGTVASQQQYLASDLQRRQEISRMLRERASAASDVAGLRGRRAWHLGATDSAGGPVPVGSDILLLSDAAASIVVSGHVSPPLAPLYATLDLGCAPAAAAPGPALPAALPWGTGSLYMTAPAAPPALLTPALPWSSVTSTVRLTPDGAGPGGPSPWPGGVLTTAGPVGTRRLWSPLG